MLTLGSYIEQMVEHTAPKFVKTQIKTNLFLPQLFVL